MIRNEANATVEFRTLEVGDCFHVSGTIFEKTRSDRAKIRFAPGMPQLGGIGPYLFGLLKPVNFVPRGTEKQETT